MHARSNAWNCTEPHPPLVGRSASQCLGQQRSGRETMASGPASDGLIMIHQTPVACCRMLCCASMLCIHTVELDHTIAGMHQTVSAAWQQCTLPRMLASVQWVSRVCWLEGAAASGKCLDKRQGREPICMALEHAGDRNQTRESAVICVAASAALATVCSPETPNELQATIASGHIHHLYS